nr:uncharacterized protein LOC124808481 [Hydra vulgaris]
MLHHQMSANQDQDKSRPGNCQNHTNKQMLRHQVNNNKYLLIFYPMHSKHSNQSIFDSFLEDECQPRQDSTRKLSKSYKRTNDSSLGVENMLQHLRKFNILILLFSFSFFPTILCAQWIPQ